MSAKKSRKTQEKQTPRNKQTAPKKKATRAERDFTIYGYVVKQKTIW